MNYVTSRSAGVKTCILVGASAACALTSTAFAEATPVAKPSVEIRYRLETVDQDGIEKKATASTARARVGWTLAASERLSIGVEADYVFVVPPGSGGNYNSTENGRAQYPVVADPTDIDLNQMFLRYTGSNLTVTAGRQRVTHAGQRFVGAVGWRQNEQTYGAFRVQSSHGRTSLDYSFVFNVNRIFGPGDGAQPGDWEGDSHLLRGAIDLGEGQTVGAFAYLLDFENANGPPNSTATFGLDYLGTFGAFSLAGSIARQADWKNSPLNFKTTYYALEARLKRDPVTFAAGYEILGSDGGKAAFRTPLATLHKFQGWADKFLATPPAGIEDAYLSATKGFGPATLTLGFHRYQAVDGGADYGSEVDALVSYPIRQNLVVLLKLASYNAKEHATDTTKFWLMLTYRF